MKVGDYVRTNVERLNIQQICKIKEILSDDFIFTDRGYYDKEYIIKSSPNIIDLIEVGDYVNGYYVEEVRGVFDGEDTYFIICLTSGSNYFQPNITENEDIKSIVTKEQFERMQYNLESEVN